MRHRGLLVVVAFGIALGLLARLVDGLAPHWVGDMAAVWILVAFWAGSHAENDRLGAALGAICLLTASLTYYFWRVRVDQTISIHWLTVVGSFWTLMSIVTGVVAGVLGSRSTRNPAMWGVVAGGFVGEAVAILVLRHRVSQALIECGIAALCLIPARRELHRAVVLGVASTLVVAFVGIGYRVVLQRGKGSHQTVPVVLWS